MSRYYLQVNQCELQRVVQYDNHRIEHTLIKLSVGDKCITNEWTFPVNTFNRIVKHVYRAHQAINTTFHTKRYVDVGTIYKTFVVSSLQGMKQRLNFNCKGSEIVTF